MMQDGFKGEVGMTRPDQAPGLEREGRPSPIDVHVGSRIRLRRTLMGMSQERLGEALGLTFQQVQKYERGVNRVGASRLFDLSRVLDVPISFFFDDMPDSLAAQPGTSGRRGVSGFAELPRRFRRRHAEPARNARVGACLLPDHRSVDPQTRVRADQVDGAGRALIRPPERARGGGSAPQLGIVETWMA